MTIPTQKPRMKSGIVSLASSLLVLSSVVASAQTDGNAESSAALEEILVQGTRQSLQNAQDIKRDADTFVDAISADDIGSLPDRSVLEAMQRLPGVSIERFAAANDPDHFGVEGSGAVVRGMSQTRSEFNGRDSFTANSGRGLSFQDVPPELMGGVQIFKNQTADMIEGGIAGTINLITRKPFDQPGRRMSFSADVTYGDMMGEWTPTYSGLFSDRWETAAGEFGFLINLAHSELKASSHGIQTDRYDFRPIENADGDPVMNPITGEPAFANVANPYVYDGTFVDAPAGVQVGQRGVLVPNGSNLTMKEDTRERTGIALATQWRSNDDAWLASLQFMRSDATLAWTENAIKYQTGYNRNSTYPGPGEQYQFDDDGVFVSGALTDIGDSGGWRMGSNRIPSRGTAGQADYMPYFGHRFQTDNRFKKTRTIVDDYAFNLEWTPTDNLGISFDLQHIRAETEDDDVTLMFMTHAIQGYNLSGSTPSVDVVSPWFYASDEALEHYRDGDGDAYPGHSYAVDNYFSDPRSYNYNAAMDHFERSEGESTAVRLDAVYFMDGFISGVRTGVRFAEREQTVRFSQYNWGALAPIWQSPVGWLDSDIVQEAGIHNQHQVIDWSDFHRGGTANIQGNNLVLHPTDALTQDYHNWGNAFGPLQYNCEDFRPAGERVDPDPNNPDNCIPRNIQDGFFLDNEINTTTETNTAAYVRVDFETELGAIPISGNVGVRYVRITNDTTGNTVYPHLRPDHVPPEGWDPYNFDPLDYPLLFDEDVQDEGDAAFLSDPLNYVDPAFRQFGNGVSTFNENQRTYYDTLPSLNLKADLTDELIARFAVSKAIALPDIGDLRNYTNIGSQGFNVNRFSYYNNENPHPESPAAMDPEHEDYDPTIYTPLNDDGDPLAQTRLVDPNSITHNGWTGSAGNPNLMPMESIQYDASLEWYFADVGSLTFSVFHKDLKNFFINGAFDRQFVNPVSGVAQTVRVAGPTNGDTGTMNGFEVAYQQFYDMLPAPWDGLGLQANYSYIRARGVPNPNLDPTAPVDEAAENTYAFGDSVPLQGQSDHTANLVAMYEKNDWSLRLAYNWRSKYLLTSRDVITGLPVYNDDAGFLDGSIYYDINDNVSIGMKAVNLLNTQTRTYQQVDGDLQLGRSWFINDRRYSLEVRANF
ncbi:TonB-dependent receptor [Marinimicrobium sp. ABcell2]|uniref:TonB-dependent receptor n=1 Tax=Marinimicrobium sp. ABcell2 TaxID=3069751 RepID=UPI0027B6C465|nr:TonB-dependent receptor [Marinimicrobium sp. ABcell2]MDQ2076046.1 TonB-dependent receptor [Marinimicrobium sp. ABcell2]